MKIIHGAALSVILLVAGASNLLAAKPAADRSGAVDTATAPGNRDPRCPCFCLRTTDGSVVWSDSPSLMEIDSCAICCA